VRVVQAVKVVPEELVGLAEQLPTDTTVRTPPPEAAATATMAVTLPGLLATEGRAEWVVTAGRAAPRPGGIGALTVLAGMAAPEARAAMRAMAAAAGRVPVAAMMP
jgi:hypothetical protein